MIFLDTQVILWLHEEEFSKFTNDTLDLIENNSLYFSPISKVEILYLNQKKMVREPAQKVIEHMKDKIGLMSPYSYQEITSRALDIAWARDPFDLLIALEVVNQKNHRLITRDRDILKEATW